MEQHALICPVCGGPYRKVVPADVAQVRCSYCGSSIVVPANTMRCPNHPDVFATAICNDCGNGYCCDCLVAYEVGGDGERGLLQLCSNCMGRRHLDRAEQTVLAGVFLIVFGVFILFVDVRIGVLWIALFAAPFLVYGFHKRRQFSGKESVIFSELGRSKKDRLGRTTQETYQDMLTEFAKSFGPVRGSVILENRLKSYMKEGLSREEAVRRFAEDEGY